MHTGKYVFAQLVEFLPQKFFQRIVLEYQGDKYVKSFSCWNQMLVMMYGQLAGCDSLRELVSILEAHNRKSYHLGFGKSGITRSNLSKANENRDYHIFEKFAYKMIDIAQKKRLTREFEIEGRFYAFDSTTIDLCLSLFWWAKFRKTKSGIKMHTLFDVATQIPAFIHITEARVHDSKAMDEIPYEPNAYYIFDRGYFDLAKLYHINIIKSNFVIRQRGKLKYEVIQGDELLDGPDNILFDQVIRLTGPLTKQKYPGKLRRIGFYCHEHRRTFIYLSNNFEIKASEIALLYKKRWQIELFFKWIKQHLHIKSFWGTSENAVRIQIYTAIIAYCLVAIVESELKLGRTTFDVLRILSASLLDKTGIIELFKHDEKANNMDNGIDLQLPLIFSGH